MKLCGRGQRFPPIRQWSTAQTSKAVLQETADVVLKYACEQARSWEDGSPTRATSLWAGSKLGQMWPTPGKVTEAARYWRRGRRPKTGIDFPPSHSNEQLEKESSLELASASSVRTWHRDDNSWFQSCPICTITLMCPRFELIIDVPISYWTCSTGATKVPLSKSNSGVKSPWASSGVRPAFRGGGQSNQAAALWGGSLSAEWTES